MSIFGVYWFNNRSFLMVQIRENWQEQVTSRVADSGLLRAWLRLGTVIMFVNIINHVLGVKEPAP